MTNQKKFDIYQVVTDQILEALDRGTIPWRKDWQGNSMFDMPINLDSRKHYRGINVLLLQLSAMKSGYSSPYWVTYKQAQKVKGVIRKGEKSTLIVYWNWIKKDTHEVDADGEKIFDKFAMLRYYRVFNVEQGTFPNGILPEPKEVAEELKESNVKNIVIEMPNKPHVLHNEGDRASYNPGLDVITMPNHDLFNSPEAYYSTIFHELAHSTGHKLRLNRKDFTGFGTEDYGKEELVAEITSSFLCSIAGIDDPRVIENQEAYIANWKKKISGDRKLVVNAAAQAQRAADYILGTTFENEEN